MHCLVTRGAHVTQDIGSASCIDHFFISPQLLLQLRVAEVQPLLGVGQPCAPPPFTYLQPSHPAVLPFSYLPSDSTTAGPAQVVEASDHAWIALQLSGCPPPLRGAIITGASSGIGLASAVLLAENGYIVAVCSRSTASLEAAFASDPAHAQLRSRLVFCVGDLSTEGGCRQAPHSGSFRLSGKCIGRVYAEDTFRSIVAQALEGLRKLGVGLNVLLNNAGRSGCIPYTTS